jgi:hypothetical protein
MLEKAKALDAEAGLQRPITYHVGKAVWFQNNPFILLFFHSLASLSLSLSLSLSMNGQKLGSLLLDLVSRTLSGIDRAAVCFV